MANFLELKTIAEGVGVAAQATMLYAWGCDEAQGFLFHRPMTADDIARLLGSVTGGGTLERKETQPWAQWGEF